MKFFLFNLKKFPKQDTAYIWPFCFFFQRFSLGGDKTTRDVSLDEIGAGEAIWTAMKDANSNCKQILANLICIRCASSSIVAVMLCATQWVTFFFKSHFYFYELDFMTLASLFIFWPVIVCYGKADLMQIKFARICLQLLLASFISVQIASQAPILSKITSLVNLRL